MSTDASPPRWAEALLRAVLRPGDFDCVSGDLLEEYRESIRPISGQRRSDAWYVTQVMGFVARGAWFWGALFASATVARTAMDWLAPPSDFHTRAAISTYLAASVLVATGFAAAWRSRTWVAGTVSGIAATVIAGVLSVVGAGLLLAIWHDPATLAAIRGSGGLIESVTLPLVMVVPGAVLGTLGGIAGQQAGRSLR
ncbi:MAG: permease prefix domain 2-containing transporter [Vicinamibacterales bacterium]|nr:permease prefix domain 2-containing transporter [Vicinamibacterales bacterium]